MLFPTFDSRSTSGMSTTRIIGCGAAAGAG
jgi:hypothetical protein